MFLRRGLLLLRQSLDWDKVASIEDLRPEEFDRKVLHPVGTTRKSINLWNKVFKKNFFQIRHELKQLSISNFRNATATDLELSGKRSAISSWRIMLLMDDDDWVSPDWLMHLPSSNKYLSFCRWKSVRYNGQLLYRLNSRDYSFTNNYCIYPCARSICSLDQVYQHFDQTKIHDKLSIHQTAYIDTPLTITHKHPASANTMRQLLLRSNWNPDSLRESIKSYLDSLSQLDFPDNLAWSKPLVERAHQIFYSAL